MDKEEKITIDTIEDTANHASAPETPDNEAADNRAADNGTPVAEAPANEAPANEAPANEAPANEAPVNETPVNEMPETPGTPDSDTTSDAPKTPETSDADKAPDSPSTPDSDTPSENPPEKKKKSKKGWVIFGAVVLTAVVGCAGAYVYKAQDYKQRFIPGTTINDVDVTDLTVDEAEAKIKDKVENYTLQISFPEGTTETLTAQDMGYSYVSDGSIQAQLDAQNPYLWGMKWVGQTNTLESSENYAMDSATLQASLEALPEFQEGNYTVSTDAGMSLGTDQQLAIVKETYGTQLNMDSVMEKLADEIELRSAETTLDSSYYIMPEVYADDAELNADLAACNIILKSKISLTLHDETLYEIGAEQTIDWLSVKDGTTNHYYVDVEKLKEKSVEAATAIAAADDCSLNSIEFHSTAGETVTISTDTYGCTVDQEKEAEQILAEVQTGETVERTPNYSEEYVDPIGDTYAEVDITNQMVYLYKNGECIVSTSCVSGKESDPDRRSDRGFFRVTRRVTDYTMKGPRDANGVPSYTSFVNYAVFYNRGEALHDASWRSKFGGTIYKSNGSHGCINLPYNPAKTIYENSYVGMPVIVF